MEQVSRMRNVTLSLMLCLLFLSNGSVAAQPASGTSSRITLELEDAEVVDVLAALARILDLELVAEPTDRLVTTTLHGVRATTALQVVCESVGCVSTIVGRQLQVRWVADPRAAAVDRTRDTPDASESQPLLRAAARDETLRRLDGYDEKLTLNLEDAELREVLGVFHKVLPGRLVIDERLQGKVTVQLVAVPAWQALEQICEIHGCRFEVQTNPMVVRVLPR